jgi:hypothetical protein
VIHHLSVPNISRISNCLHYQHDVCEFSKRSICAWEASQQGDLIKTTYFCKFSASLYLKFLILFLFPDVAFMFSFSCCSNLNSLHRIFFLSQMEKSRKLTYLTYFQYSRANLSSSIPSVSFAYPYLSSIWEDLFNSPL